MHVVSPRAMLIVRVPPEPESVGFRAYAEPLQTQSVLVWAVGRLRKALPTGVRMACVCDRPSELALLSAAYRHSDYISFLTVNGRVEAAQYRTLMDEQAIDQLIVTRLYHAVLDPTTITQMLNIHRSANADLTDVRVPGCAKPLYVLQAAIIDALLTAAIPQLPDEIVPAATLLREARRLNPTLAPEFLWLRLDAPTMSAIELRRWPQEINIQTGMDVEVLREAVSKREAEGCSEQHFVDAWKRSTISVRQRRLRGPLLCHSSTKDRARVLYIGNLSYFVGASQSLCHLIDGLDRQRYEPFAFVPYSGVFANELRRRGVTVICPNQRIDETTTDNMDLAARTIDECHPDIIHGNHDIGIPFAYMVRAARVPFVQHVRVQTPQSLALLIHMADAVIAVSSFVRDRILELDIEPRKIEVIHNGVNIEQFTPAPFMKTISRQRLGIPDDAFVVAMIARLVRYKHHDTVIRAIAHLRRATGRGHLILVGGVEADRSYHRAVCTLIEQEGLSSHTTHIDFTSDVPSVLHASDALALLSKDEALGRVVLEAMAVGLPVVVSDSGGPREVVDSGRNGFVVPHGRVDVVATTLELLATHPQRAQEIGAAAVTAIRERFTAAHCAQRTMAVYDRLLATTTRH